MLWFDHVHDFKEYPKQFFSSSNLKSELQLMVIDSRIHCCTQIQSFHYVSNGLGKITFARNTKSCCVQQTNSCTFRESKWYSSIIKYLLPDGWSEASSPLSKLVLKLCRKQQHWETSETTNRCLLTNASRVMQFIAENHIMHPLHQNYSGRSTETQLSFSKLLGWKISSEKGAFISSFPQFLLLSTFLAQQIADSHLYIL